MNVRQNTQIDMIVRSSPSDYTVQYSFTQELRLVVFAPRLVRPSVISNLCTVLALVKLPARALTQIRRRHRLYVGSTGTLPPSQRQIYRPTVCAPLHIYHLSAKCRVTREVEPH